jgi:hypothetical protein
MTTRKTLNNEGWPFGRPAFKTESIAERHRRYDVAMKFWSENKHLNRVQVCEKFGFTESAMRSHMARYEISRPDGYTPSNPLEGRKAAIRDGYNLALETDMTARAASTWASKKHGVRIGRSEIQFYATKFDLPYLKEDKGFEIGKLCKYA